MDESWHRVDTDTVLVRPYGASMADGAATPWGKARLVDEVRLQQRAGTRRFSSFIQLLEAPDGEQLVRFAYATDGVARRGPVTLRARDVARLKSQLDGHPELAAALRLTDEPLA